jgi:hypothetical protein
MVQEVFSANFSDGLKLLAKLRPNPSFVIRGEIFPTEIVLSASLVHKDELAATTLFASVEFDPKASSPSIQDLLSACEDALAGIFSDLLNPEKPERIECVATESLASLEGVPFHWTEVKVDKYRIHVKIDKSNPTLDEMADQFLDENDPEFKARAEAEEKATEDLFVTGPKQPGSKKKPVH